MRKQALLLSVALTITTVACGGGEDATTLDSTTTTTTVELPDLTDVTFTDDTGAAVVNAQARDNTFVPQYLEVSTGAEVVFTNKGGTPHNVIASIKGAFPSITADTLVPGADASITFDEAGDYPYYCSLHGTPSRAMFGVIRVVDSPIDAEPKPDGETPTSVPTTPVPAPSIPTD